MSRPAGTRRGNQVTCSRSGCSARSWLQWCDAERVSSTVTSSWLSSMQAVMKRINQSVCYLTVEADSSSSEVSVHVQTSSPLIHLGVVVTVERVPVTVTRWNETVKAHSGWFRATVTRQNDGNAIGVNVWMTNGQIIYGWRPWGRPGLCFRAALRDYRAASSELLNSSSTLL